MQDTTTETDCDCDYKSSQKSEPQAGCDPKKKAVRKKRNHIGDGNGMIDPRESLSPAAAFRCRGCGDN
jgi:hypothetical protein